MGRVLEAVEVTEQRMVHVVTCDACGYRASDDLALREREPDWCSFLHASFRHDTIFDFCPSCARGAKAALADFVGAQK
jgi:hypothetical protein